MAKYTMGESIIISVVIGSILLYLLGISGIFTLIIIGFVATYLTVENQRSYQVGGIAGGFLGIVLFVFSFFTPPDLPYSLNIGTGFAFWGILTLIFGLIISLMICYLFGALGGYIATKILKKRIKTSSHEKKSNNKRFNNKRPKKPKKARNSLQRTYY